jgi:F-type H+-transporting ATPase subunit a
MIPSLIFAVPEMNLYPSLFAEGLTKNPVQLFSIDGFGINNSMISEIIVVAIIITVCQLAMRAPKLIPSGLQNFVEWLVESMRNFLELIMGRETTARGFWYFGGIMVFVLMGNLLGLVPGVGTFGIGHVVNGHFQVTEPFLRGANANDNLTAAYSAIFFFMFFYWCVRQAGVGGSLYHIFGTKVKFANPLAHWLFILIFFIVGWVELFTILIVRPIAFTFRLYGNIFGGEYLLDSIYKMAPNFAFIVLVPFYFYELLVACVQAFVFFVLTAAFTGIITSSSSHLEESPAGH